MNKSYTAQPMWCDECGYDLRSTLHLQGADIVHSALHDVLAGWGELHAFALEVLLVVYCDLDMDTETSL